MRTRTNQSGFSVVELAIVFVILAVLALVGYGIYSRQNSETVDSSTNQTGSSKSAAKANDIPSVPAVNSTGDLDKALATIDQTDPGGSNNTDASQLDSQLTNF
jgi:prepilin-type N-terminal cleavage/methylation domain-containing protein